MIEALLLTLRVAIVAVALGLLPGVLLGVWFARSKSPFVLGVEALVMAPLVLPPVATGLLLLILFSHLPLLHSLPFTWWAASVAAAVMALPLIVSSVRTAVRGVDPELEAVARTLGAGPLRVLRSITLPLSWRGIVAGGASRVLQSDRGVWRNDGGGRKYSRPDPNIGVGHLYLLGNGARQNGDAFCRGIRLTRLCDPASRAEDRSCLM